MHDETKDEAAIASAPAGANVGVDDGAFDLWPCVEVATGRVFTGPPAGDRRDDREGGGNLTPMPLREKERDGLRALGAIVADPGGLAHAIRRYRFIQGAHGLGLGMDPDLVLGVRTALDALILLYATRPAADGRDARAKRGRLARSVVFAAGHVGPVLRLCMALDRQIASRRREVGP